MTYVNILLSVEFCQMHKDRWLTWRDGFFKDLKELGGSLAVHAFALLWLENQPHAKDKFIFNVLAQRFLVRNLFRLKISTTFLSAVFDFTDYAVHEKLAFAPSYAQIFKLLLRTPMFCRILNKYLHHYLRLK